ncbi:MULTISPECIES: hypothetical protein [unclassified Streptomyces]|uniref:Uncharacterized protein n=1 Tax=Streptomyces sp. NBC_00060 TaxID=2975636 RepID=A0AAU2GR63_9ACTN
MNHRQCIASSVATAVIAGALALGISPAAFASDTPSRADRTATVVEKATGTADVAVTPMPGIVVPQHSAGNAKVTTTTGSSVFIGLPDTRNVAGTAVGQGTTVYPDAAPATDLAVQLTKGGGVRALTVLKSVDAPREQRYDIGLPEGARLVKFDSEAVAAIAEDGSVLGGFDVPWAKDASGASVPTSYRVEGSTLIQTIRTAPDTTFPVTADPWWNPTSWSSWGKTKCIAKTSQGGAVMGGISGAFTGPGAAAGAGIGAVAGAAGGIWSC